MAPRRNTFFLANLKENLERPLELGSKFFWVLSVEVSPPG
jgi:hypothetical protein